MPTIITRGAISAKAYGFGVSGGYSVSKSLRFRSSASAYLNRTFGTPTSATTWTLSWWAKLGAVQTNGGSFFGSYTSSASNFAVRYNTPGAYGGTGCNIEIYNNGSVMDLMTAGIFRDPSAWYHFCITFDSTQATASNRLKFYINGVQATFATFTTYPNQNTSVVWNTNGTTCLIGALNNPLTSYYDGYMAEVNFIDGQALAASSFGAYDTNGVWQPIKYSGSFGTNGFYLNFGNTTSTTTLGYDTSGNSNNWTTNNISLTAGSTYDSMTDSPTVSSTTVANYATMNPLDTGSTITLSEGNLKTTSTATSNTSRGTIGMTSGKWYWEVQVVSGGNYVVGIGTGTFSNSTSAFTAYAGGYGYVDNGNKQNNGTAVAYGGTMAAGDIIGVAFDATAGSLTFYKNNTSQGVAYTGLTNGPYFPAASCQSSVMVANFGQRPFTYTPPTGFNALNTYNLPTPTIANGAQYMAATLWTGTGAAQSVLNSANNTIGTTFQPDFVWMKSRGATYVSNDHNLFDVLRGVNNALFTDLTDAETTYTSRLNSFDSSGFTTGAQYNANNGTFVGWQWKANGAGVTNTNGSITSTVSANTTAGFSVVTYTGTGANATVGHGLGVAPSMVITKSRAVASNWPSYHSSLGAGNVIFLNATNASVASATIWNNTSPTSSVFSVGADPNFPAGTMVAYCWAAVPGYSAFGSYTGNGSTDGPFVYTGFRPRFVLFKRTDAVNTWLIYDTSRSPYNADVAALYPNSFAAETTDDPIDYLSNGFKMRGTGNLANTSGGTYIYAAFAESPFNTARAR